MRNAEKKGEKAKGSFLLVSSTHEDPAIFVDLPRRICSTDFSTEEESSFEIPRLDSTQHPSYPAATNYRLPRGGSIVAAVHVACEEERYRASIVARSFRSGYDRTLGRSDAILI